MDPVSNTLPILSLATRSYDAYGYRDLSADGARTGFAGEISEAELPWYLLGERFYVPSLRRFISPDGASPFEVGGLNRYAYCSGDPLNRIDPSGEGAFKWVMLGIGLAISAVALVMSAGTLIGAVGAGWVNAAFGFSLASGVSASTVGAAIAATTAATTVSTSTLLTMTAAVVIDTIAIVAEIGSIVTEATGDEKAQDIFGYIDVGTSLARLGLGGAVKTFGKNLKVGEKAIKVVNMRKQFAQTFEFATDIGQLIEKKLDEIAASRDRSPEKDPETTMTETRSMRSAPSAAQGDPSFAATRYTSPPVDASRAGISSWPGNTDSQTASNVLDSSPNGLTSDVRADRPDRNESLGFQRENPLSNLPREVERSILWSRTNHSTGRSDEGTIRISHPRENIV